MTTKPVYFTQEFTIAAGQSYVVNVAGTFVRCLYSNQAGTPFGLVIDAQPQAIFDQGLGAQCAPGDSFKSITVYNNSASLLTVELAFGQGNLIDNRLNLAGVVTVAGSVALAEGGNLAIISSDNLLGVSSLPNARAVNRVGDSFSNQLAVGLTAVQIVAPASNVNGVIVRGNTQIYSTGSNVGVISIGAAAPSVVQSNECLMWGEGGFSMELGHDVLVPPGNGIWVIANAAGSANITISYKVL